MDFSPVIDFIRKEYGSEGFIPLHAPLFIGNEKRYLEECIDSTFVSSVGAFVDRFEKEMADYTGARRAVVCVNGTNALQMALIMAGVESGDEVITQPLTFIATCNALSYLGASPVFIDVERSTLGLSPEAMEEWLKGNAEMRGNDCHDRLTGRRIRACVPMHTFGHPARTDAIADVCRRWGIMLVEDAAESIGSFYRGRHTGLEGLVGAISFNGNKTITTGGGGMLLFNDEALAEKARHLTTQAKVPHRWEFVHDAVGYNFRMPNINAALGCAQLEQLPRFIEAKRATAARYADFFSSIPEIEFITEPEGARSNYWLNAVLLPDRESRDAFLQATNDAGVMTRPAWELMHRLPMFSDARRGPLDTSEWIADRLVNIPSSVRIG